MPPKRKAKAKQPRTGKKARFNDGPVPDESPRPIADPTYEDLGFTPDKHRHTSLHQFFHGLQNGRYKAAVTYTPPPVSSPARHILDMEPYPTDERQFVLIEDQVELVDWEPSNGKKTRAWRLPAQNLADGTPIFELFTLPKLGVTNLTCPPCRRSEKETGKRAYCEPRKRPCNKCTGTVHEDECRDRPDQEIFNEHKWITEATCPEEERAAIVKLGQIQVDILNRYPFEIVMNTFPSPYVFEISKEVPFSSALTALHPPQKQFIDLVSLFEWKKRDFPAFDFRQMSDISYASKEPIGFFHAFTYGIPLSGLRVKSSDMIAVMKSSPLWKDASLPDEEANYRIRFSSNPAQFGATLEGLDHLDSYVFFGRFFEDDALHDKDNSMAQAAKTDLSLARCLRARQHGLLATVGLIGEASEVLAAFHEACSRFQQKADTVHNAYRTGPCNGRPLWQTPSPTQRNRVAFVTTLPLGRDWVLHSSTIRDRACISHVLDASTQPLMDGKPLSWAIFEACRMADALESGIVTRQMVIEQMIARYQQMGDSVVWIYCMHCNKPVSSAHTDWVATSEGPRLFCRICRHGPYALSSFEVGQGLLGRLEQLCQSVFAWDSKVYTPQWDPKQLAKQLFGKYGVDAQPTKCLGGYSSAAMDLNHGRFGQPRAISIEKPHQQDGEDLHSYANCTLCPRSINYLKSNKALSFIPLAKEALLLGKEELGLGDPLGSKYHPSLEKKWERHENAQDHDRIISALTAPKSKARLSAPPAPEVAKEIRRMERSGVWDRSVVRRPTGAKLFAHRADRACANDWPIDLLWSDDEWRVLIDLIKSMEADRLVCNPRGEEVLWVGKNHDIPWFWNPKHCPEDVSIEYLWRTYSSQFRTMDEACDPKNDHSQESPDTLLLLDARQWFLDGGRCHFFKVRKTLRTGYLSTSSKGRAFERTLADGTKCDVLPNEKMQSGWTKRHPTSLDDFKLELLTIIDESVTANRYRWCWSPGTETEGNRNFLFPLLEQTLLDCYDKCEYYDAVSKDIPPLPTPPTWKNNSKWYADFYGRCEHVIDSAGEEPDDETEAVQAIVAELLAATDADGAQLLNSRQARLDAELERVAELECASDDAVQELVTQLQAMTQGVDVDDNAVGDDAEGNGLPDDELFEQHMKQLVEALDSIQALRDKRPLCFNCALPVQDTDAMCMTAGHSERRLHFHCLKSTDKDDSSTWRCKDCTDTSGGSGSGPAPTASGGTLNLFNLTNTCYMSSSITPLYAIMPVRSFVLDPGNEQHRGHKQSGRHSLAWLSRSYVTPTGDGIEINTAQHMRNAAKVVSELRQLFIRMGQSTRPIRRNDVDPFFTALEALDWKEWIRGQQNDSADVLTHVLEAIILVTDQSTYESRLKDQKEDEKELQKRGLLCDLCHDSFDDRVETPCCRHQYCRNCLNKWLAQNQERCPQPACTQVCRQSDIRAITQLSRQMVSMAQPGPLTVEATSKYFSMRRYGWESAISDSFCLQTVQEAKCLEPDCGIISRKYNFEHQILDLGWEDEDSDQNSLTRMLQMWQRPDLDENNRRGCASGCRSHVGSQLQHRRITRASPYIYIRFTRIRYNLRAEQETVPAGVNIPSFLDISPYADGAVLPSDEENIPTKLGVPSVYQLIVVNIFIPGMRHYVAYILEDGVWLKYDDLAGPHTIQEHPQAAISGGGIVYYVIYREVKGKTSLPKNSQGEASEGHILGSGQPVPDAKEQPANWEVAYKFPCPSAGCGLSFESNDRANTHNSHAHGEGSGGDQPMVICDRCEHVLFHFEWELTAHVRAKHSHRCGLCGKTFPSKTAFETHKNECKLTCGSCNEEFGSKDSLDAHVKAEHSHRCGLCEKTFTSKTDFETHKTQCKLTCDSCNEEFSSKDSLRDHASICPGASKENIAWRKQQLEKLRAEMEATLAGERQKLKDDFERKLGEEKKRLEDEYQNSMSPGTAMRIRKSLNAEKEMHLAAIQNMRGMVRLLDDQKAILNDRIKDAQKRVSEVDVQLRSLE